MKYGPKSIELQKVVEADETIKSEVDEDISNVIGVTDYSIVEDEVQRTE